MSSLMRAPTQFRHESTTVGGAAIDLLKYQGDVLVILSGTNTHAGGTAKSKLQQSDDGSTGWADISGAETAAASEHEVKNKVLILDRQSCKRYIKAVEGEVASSGVAAGNVEVFGMPLTEPIPSYS